ncbi:MAG: TOBE domain-containing protein, partial [Opitutales bacterium]
PRRSLLNGRLAEAATRHGRREVVLGIRPEDLASSASLTDEDAARRVSFNAALEVCEPVGAETFLYLTTGAHAFIAKVSSDEIHERNGTVTLGLNLDKAHLFDPESGRVLR